MGFVDLAEALAALAAVAIAAVTGYLRGGHVERTRPKKKKLK